MSRFAAVGLALLGVVPAAQETGAPPRPNFLVILCDDLGYGDLGCYGHDTIRTPRLDRLAAEGLRLTDGYSASPLCSPARAGLLTGRTPSRTGVYSWIPDGNPMYLPREERTVAALLSEAGYATGHFGKWHLNGTLGSGEQPQPGDHGFEHWFSTQNNARPSHIDPKNFVRNGEPVEDLQGSACYLVANEAVSWLMRVQMEGRPFFAFVCFHEPHEPVASPPALVREYTEAGVEPKNRAQYYANVTNMDGAVERLLAALDLLGLAESTLVWFTSDNGPETLNRYRGAGRSYGSAGPLRDMKLSTYEGGIRVPAILRWPGRIEAGRVSSTPVSAVDVLPTLCELAGVEPPGDRILDGVSVVPLLEGGELERGKPLFWHYYAAPHGAPAALRMGPWKLVGFRDGPREHKAGGIFNAAAMESLRGDELAEFELYDLAADVGEGNDLAEEWPGRAAALRAQLVALFEEVIGEGPGWEFP